MIESLEINLYICLNRFLTKLPRHIQWGKNSFSTNGAWIIGYPDAKE